MVQFNSSPMFQASLGLVVLFVAFAAHMYTQPYLRPADEVRKRADSALKKMQAIRAKEQLAVTHGVEVAAPPAAPPAAESGSGDAGRRTVPTLERSASSLRRLMVEATEKSKRYLFDYNKIEMAFLFCSSAVLLSGIMFKSGFYVEGTSEHAGLTGFVLVVVGSCTALFLFVFCSETVRAA